MLAMVLEANIEEEPGGYDDVVVIRPRLTGDLLLAVHLLKFHLVLLLSPAVGPHARPSGLPGEAAAGGGRRQSRAEEAGRQVLEEE